MLLSTVTVTVTATTAAAASFTTLVAFLAVAPPQPRETSGTEVRQLVVFDFLPGKTAEALALFESEALPLYRENEPMLRFRGYREVESPVPLDLIVVSSFTGMAGMDASNRALRVEAEKRGTSIGALYGRIGELSQSHHDSFVEVVAELSWGARDRGPLLVLESFRAVPGGKVDLERLLREKLVPWEREASLTTGGETSRYLVSDGLDYLRIHSVNSLGDWHRYLNGREAAPFAEDLDALIAASRQIIVATLEELSVR